MIFAKDTTYGLETTIKDLQSHIDSELEWAGTNNIYGLLYPTLRNDNNVLEAYIGSGTKFQEYNEVLVNDKVTSSIGFLVSGSRTLGGLKSAEVDVIVTMRLDRAYGNEIRQDEKAMLEFEAILNSFFGISSVISSETGVEDVFSGYYTGGIKHRDMHPWAVFSMRVNLEYDDDLCR